MPPISYARHQFPPVLIQHAVWLYLRFTLSYRDVEDLLAERGVVVSYETVRRWVLKFGPLIARACGVLIRIRVGIGTSTRWWLGSPGRRCISGAPSITRARCWGFVTGTAACMERGQRRYPSRSRGLPVRHSFRSV